MTNFTYFCTITHQYPLYQGDVRLRYPEIGEQFVLPEGCSIVEVELKEPPPFSNTQYYVEKSPVFEDGKWKRVYQVVDYTPEELAILQKNKDERAEAAKNSSFFHI